MCFVFSWARARASQCVQSNFKNQLVRSERRVWSSSAKSKEFSSPACCVCFVLFCRCIASRRSTPTPIAARLSASITLAPPFVVVVVVDVQSCSKRCSCSTGKGLNKFICYIRHTVICFCENTRVDFLVQLRLLIGFFFINKRNLDWSNAWIFFLFLWM